MRWSRLAFVVVTLTLGACTSGPEPASTTTPDTAQPVTQLAPDDVAHAANAPSSTAHHTDGKVPEPTIDPVANGPANEPRAGDSGTPAGVGGTAGTAALPAAATAPRAAAAREVREVTLPAGTILSLELGSTVSSKSSGIEDPVHATVRRAVVVDGATVIPPGAAVSGHVTESTRSGRVKGLARVGMRFTALRVGDERYKIRTAAIAREARATKKKDAAKIGIGAGAGAVTGAIVGGGKGAAIGTAVGAGGGTAVVLATRGEEVSLVRGTVVTARLAEPVRIRIH